MEVNLKSATKAFVLWRINKKSEKEPIPEHLLAMVKQLSHEHSPRTLSHYLGILMPQLHAILERNDDYAEEESEHCSYAPEFAMTQYASRQDSAEITLKKGDNILSIKFSGNHLVTLLPIIGAML